MPRSSLLILPAISLLGAGSAFAATITVDDSGDIVAADGRCTLREAIGNANANADLTSGDCVAGDNMNDTIVFDSALSGSTILLQNGELIIADAMPGPDEGVMIDGSSASVTVDANGMSRVFNVQTDASFGWFTITNGSVTDDNGGAIYNTASLDLTDCSITNSQATGTGGAAQGSGGGIFNGPGGTVTIDGGVLSGNLADRAGGAIEDASGEAMALSIAGAIFTGNGAGIGSGTTAAPGNGGAIHITGAGGTMIDGGLFSANSAAAEGGALWNGSGTMWVGGGVSIDGNTAAGDDASQGGGGLFQNNGGLLQLDEANVSNNTATGTSGSGGGILVEEDSQLEITDSAIWGNIANRAGGAIELRANTTTTIQSTNLEGNNAGVIPATAAPGNGGALHITGPGSVSITGGSVTGNMAAREGGGLWNDSGIMTVNDVTIDSNEANGDTADDGGGGVFNNAGTVELIDSRVTNNSALGAAGSGGGVLTNDGTTLDVNGGTIAFNICNRAGGGVEARPESQTNLMNTRFEGNNAGMAPAVAAPGNGGGVHVTGSGNVLVSGGSFTTNTAAAEGGGLWNGSGLMLIQDGASVDNNWASGDDATQGGGGLFQNNGGEIRVTDSFVTNNVADGAAGSGGGIFVEDNGTVSVTGGEISGNRSNRAGGGIEVRSFTTTTLSGVEMRGNNTGVSPATAAPGNGGALHVTGADGPSTVNVDNCEIADNLAAREGGGLWNNATGGGRSVMTVDNSVFTGNEARGDAADDGGGALFNNGGDLYVRNLCVIDGNHATGTSGSGGGIFNNVGGLTEVYDSMVTGNSSNRAGGGIENVADLLVVRTTLRGNDAGSNPGNGGGLHSAGAATAVFDRSTASGNNAREGGGLWNSGASVLNVYNSTVSGNTATRPAPSGGGGIFQQAGSAGTMTMLNVTVAENQAAGNGGGFQNSADNLVVAGNVIFGDNSAPSGPDVFGSLNADYCVIEIPAGAVITGGNNIHQDPVLAPLGLNGGTTETHDLLDGSPAIDAGDDAICMGPEVDNMDQREVPRPDGNGCDIGAVESAAVVPVAFAYFNAEAGDAVGEVNLRWATALEVDHAGFFVYRSENSGETWEQLSDELVTGDGVYGFADRSAAPSTRYFYRLEAISNDGVPQLSPAREITTPDWRTPTGLQSVSPNPVVGSATVSFSLSAESRVRLSVYDATGREVQVLGQGNWSAGTHAVEWDGRLSTGQSAADGVYFVRMSHDTGAETRKIVLRSGN